MPENRSDPKSRTIRILVARVKAISNTLRPDPTVFLAGGPGGAGTLSALGVVTGGMNAERDVIFVNQRGTVHSDPHLSCPEMDDFTAQGVYLVLEAPSTADLDAAAVAACRKRLTSTGVDLAAYNSHENASDIADLRVKLGINQWNVYGVSYGTVLAQQLLRDHPEGIRSVVLDSVVPPSLNIVDRWWEAPAGGLAATFQACADQAACAAAYPDLPTLFSKTVNKLSQTPADVTTTGPAGDTVRVTVDGFKLVPLVLDWSADPGKVADIPRMISALANGLGSLAAAGIAANAPPPEERGLLGGGLALGDVLPRDGQLDDAGPGPIPGEDGDARASHSVLRMTPTGSWIFRECDAWWLGRSNAADRRPVVSAVPTLILSGAFDSSTAPQRINEVTAGLSNSVVLHFPGTGHAVIPNSGCAQAIMTAFVDNPRRDVDQSCIRQTAVPTFSLP